MARLLRVSFFLILLTNSLTLSGGPLPFDVYTLDIALVPFALLVTAKTIFRPGPGLRLTPFDPLFVLLLTLIIVSLLFSVNRELSLTNTFDWLRLVAIYFLARSVCGSVVSERTLIIQFAIMTILLIGLGLLQMVTGEPIGIIADYFGESREQYGWHRVSGPTPNSNLYATWVIVYGGLSLSVLLSKARPFLWFALAGAMAIVMIGTLSRGGALGFAVFILVLLLMHSKRAFSSRFLIPTIFLTLSLMGVMFVMVIANVHPILTRGVNNLINRQVETRDFEEGGQRWELMQLGLSLLTRPKVAAVGCGTGGMMLESLSGSRSSTATSRSLVKLGVDAGTGVHNVWIATAVENGIPSAAILLSIVVLFVRQTSRLRRSENDGGIWSSYLMAIGVWYLVVASQVYLVAARLPILLPLVILIAFVANRSSQKPGFHQASERVSSKAGSRPGSLAL